MLVAFVSTLASAPARADNAPAGLRLDGSVRAIDLWSAVRVLAETDRELTPQEALGRAGEFVVPDVPHSNLGVRTDAVWFRVDLDLAEGAPTRWIFDVSYPPLNHVELYQIADGAVVRAVGLGSEVLLDQRPLTSRTHAVELDFGSGQRHALLLRVRTSGSMVLPLALSLPTHYMAREARAEATQGVFAGIAVFLLIFSLTEWLALRDGIFGYYAASIAGVTLFFLSYSGLGPEHLWPASAWLNANAAPLAILVALWGAFLFLERILVVTELSRPVSRLMTGLAWTALAVGVAFALGLVGYRTVQTISTLLGTLPMLLGVPMAYARMRRGDRIMAYLLAGWVLYAVGATVMAALLRGVAPWNALTRDAFQISSMAEMTLWLVLLGQRVREIRETGERAHREHEALRSMAQTDALTGLANRRGLDPALREAVQASSPARLAAVFMIDLDGFKQVNDQHGHDVGDQLLIALSKRLRQHVRRADFIARTGGDEFVVVAGGFPAETEARLFGQKLVEAFDTPFRLHGDLVCRVSLTIGYALAPSDGRDASSLLRQADASMYNGKQGGKHCLRRDLPSTVEMIIS